MRESHCYSIKMMSRFSPIAKVLLIAFIVRMGLPLFVIIATRNAGQLYDSDSFSYLRPAQTLAYNGVFQSYINTPEITRGPGYPILLIPGILLNHILSITISIQIILSCLTVFLIYKIAMLLFSKEGPAILCALCYAVEPLSLFYTCRIMTETLFSTLFVLFLYFILMFIKDQSYHCSILAGIALAFSALVRPVSFYLIYLVPVVLLLWIILKRAFNKKAIISLCIFILCSSSIAGSWMVRNGIEADYWGFSGYEAFNAYFYKACAILAEKNHVPFYEMQKQMGFPDLSGYFLKYPEQRSWTQAQILRSMHQEGTNIIFNNLSIYSIIYFKGTVRVLFEPGAADYLKLFKLYPQSGGVLGVILDQGLLKALIQVFNDKPLLFWSSVLFEFILLLYFLSALYGLFSKDIVYTISIIMVLIAGLYLLAPVGEFGMSRYRQPFMPVLCLFSGYGLYALFSKFKSRAKS